MEHEIVGQELVKCVLVGDTAVGKTRLICARACNARVSLRQLLSTHVPTVWAIDQYRIYKEVLERSMEIVDGVQVSLRLWDTFGDHEKDRRFAYGRSDIILLCFSVGSRSSLLHCKSTWIHEIRRFCPETPVILVGCKNDLRFLCRDSEYLAFCRDRSPFLRPSRECDLVMPEQARALANEIGVPYYETSVFTYYGVNEVFENAIRAALIARRNQRFWMTNLKHVQLPLLQAPYCPPKLELNVIEISGKQSYWNDIKSMFVSQTYPDLIFIADGGEVTAHRFIVAAGAPQFQRYLESAELSHTGCRRNSETSTGSGSTVDETECLLGKESCREDLGILNSTFASPDLEWNGGTNHLPHIHSVKMRNLTDIVPNSQVVIKLVDDVSIETVRSNLYFLYTGELPNNFKIPNEEDLEKLDLFKIPEFAQCLDFMVKRETKHMPDIKRSYRQFFKGAMWGKCMEDYYPDVLFHLDDGKLSAHRAILMARSDVMRAMFCGDFKERRSHSVSLPGVKKVVFLAFLEYLYTDSISPPVPLETGMPLVELANRLCLPRLVNILENILIKDLAQKHGLGIDVTDELIKVLEPAQLHNAEQLAQWCLIQLSTNYDNVCRSHSKVFKELNPENRQWISIHRWPPVWYVKDFDYYQKALLERYKSENTEKKGRKRNSSGCLVCFKSRRSRRNDDQTEKIRPNSPSLTHPE